MKINLTVWKKSRNTIQFKSDEFITKESQRKNVSVLINLPQDFKMVKHVLIEQQ